VETDTGQNLTKYRGNWKKKSNQLPQEYKHTWYFIFHGSAVRQMESNKYYTKISRGLYVNNMLTFTCEEKHMLSANNLPYIRPSDIPNSRDRP